MHTAEMNEARYWPALEYRVTREMGGDEECTSIGLWCDGFLPDACELGGTANRITGRVWVGIGHTQQAWTFELQLPCEAKVREQIPWAELLPADDRAGWLRVDLARRHLVIDPGASVDPGGGG